MLVYLEMPIYHRNRQMYESYASRIDLRLFVFLVCIAPRIGANHAWLARPVRVNARTHALLTAMRRVATGHVVVPVTASPGHDLTAVVYGAMEAKIAKQGDANLGEIHEFRKVNKVLLRPQK